MDLSIIERVSRLLEISPMLFPVAVGAPAGSSNVRRSKQLILVVSSV